MTTDLKPHPYADVLRAIADGIPVQARWSNHDWFDFDITRHTFHTFGLEWRIKPKPKVKKWRWVVTDYRNTRALSVSVNYYKDLADFNTKNMHGVTVAVQQIDSTMIEVEE